MAEQEFRLSSEEANFLTLEEIDCGPPPSILDHSSRSSSSSDGGAGSPVVAADGLNFEDFDFDWDNDSIDDLVEQAPAFSATRVDEGGNAPSLADVGCKTDVRPVVSTINPIPLKDIRIGSGSTSSAAHDVGHSHNGSNNHCPVVVVPNTIKSLSNYSSSGRETPASTSSSSVWSVDGGSFSSSTATPTLITDAPSKSSTIHSSVTVSPSPSHLAATGSTTKFHTGSASTATSISSSSSAKKEDEAKRRRAIRKGIIHSQRNQKRGNGATTTTTMTHGTTTHCGSTPPSNHLKPSAQSSAVASSSPPSTISLSSFNETKTIITEVNDIAQRLLNESTLFRTSTPSLSNPPSSPNTVFAPLTNSSGTSVAPKSTTPASVSAFGGQAATTTNVVPRTPPPPPASYQTRPTSSNTTSSTGTSAVSSLSSPSTVLTPIPEETTSSGSSKKTTRSSLAPRNTTTRGPGGNFIAGSTNVVQTPPGTKGSYGATGATNTKTIPNVSVPVLNNNRSSSIDDSLEEEYANADLPMGNDPESRKQRRLIRNRLSAALHRKRKRETIDTQKRIIDEKDNEIAHLKQQLQKVTSNYNEIKTDFDALVNHFGYREIKNILARTPAPPAEIMGGSSDHSVDSSLDSPSGAGAGASPMHTPTYHHNEDHHHHQGLHPNGRATVTTNSNHAVTEVTSLSSTAMPSHPTVVAGRNNNSSSKKKRKSLPAMATMAMCAVLGCVVLPPSIFKVLDPDGSGLQTANVIISSDLGSDARRRLDEAVSPDEMSAMAKWSSELSVSKLIHDRMNGGSMLESTTTSSSSSGAERRSGGQRTYVISPIESQPTLWRRDSVTGSPWIVDRSVTLFDVRAAIVAGARVPPAIFKQQYGSSSGGVVPFYTSSALSRELLVVPKTGAKVDTSTVFAGHLRGSSANQNKRLLSSWTEEDDEEQNTNNDRDESLVTADDTSIDIVRDARSSSSMMPSSSSSKGTSTKQQLGPNFMFCPSAYASFAPGFLQLAGLSAGAEDEEDNIMRSSRREHSWSSSSDLYQSKEDIKSDMIVDFDDDDDDNVVDEDFEDAASVANDEEENEDKALVVPSYDPYLTKSAFPSFGTTRRSGVGPNGTGEASSIPLLKNVFTSGTNGDPYMSILVPASTLSTNLSLWGSKEEEDNDHVGNDAPTPAWVELGCHVLSAKYVDGVHFV